MLRLVNLWLEIPPRWPSWLALSCTLLTLAACAPEEGWGGGDSRGPRCAQVQCDAQNSLGCLASTPGITLRVDEGLESLGPIQGSVAILPWTLHEKPPACAEQRGCPGEARCLLGRCWSSPRSASQLRRWFRGQAPLPGALPGWRVQFEAPSQLRLKSEIAVEFPQAPAVKGGRAGALPRGEALPLPNRALWAIYANANWVTPLGHPVGARLQPLAFLSIQSSGKGGWSQVQPRVEEPQSLAQAHLTMAIPRGWIFDPRWSVELRCALGSRWPLGSCQGAETQLRCVLPDPALHQLRIDLCRSFVRIPGHAPFASPWFSAVEKDLGPR